MCFSLSAIPKWDPLDQVSVADGIYMGLDPYPSPNSDSLWGVSVYFPGVALLAAFLMKIFSNENDRMR